MTHSWKKLLGGFCSLAFTLTGLHAAADILSDDIIPLRTDQIFTHSTGVALEAFDGKVETVQHLDFKNRHHKQAILRKTPEGFRWEIKLLAPTTIKSIGFDWQKAPEDLQISYTVDGKNWQKIQRPEKSGPKQKKQTKKPKKVQKGQSQKIAKNLFKTIKIGQKLTSLRILIPKAAMNSKVALKELSIFNAKNKDIVPALFKQETDTEKAYQQEVRKALAAKAGTREVVYATRGLINDGHWYANFGYYAQDPQKKAFSKGGQLCKMDIVTGKVTVLLEDAQGTFRDPVVHYDGKTILFSYRKGGSDVFHLYEIQADGSALKQLTDGIYDDIEPCYLPDDNIMFISARARRWVNCWLTPVATLYRCDRHGKNIRQISANIEHDNTPWVLPDGRVMYQRWEYIDRSQVNFHHLWTTNPDGTGQMVYFGNQNPGGVFIDAKPLPNSDRVVFLNSPRHGRREHEGRIATVSERNGPDDLSQIQYISHEWDYRDPYPISQGLFFAARHNRMLVIDKKGNKFHLLHQHKYGWPHEPRPIVKRKRERIIPDRIDLRKTTGTLILTDVYQGRNMKGVKRGEIKKLLVVESLPKPVNYTGSMEPMTYGGSFTLERILGTVPVEPDGSAHFEVPANRSIFLIALDENDSSVKRMQSFLTVMPGEVTSCVGCHEERSRTPVKTNPGVLQALKRPASQIAQVKGIPDVFDYPRDIQPILDKHCVSCHNPTKRKGKVILTGDHGPLYSHSFYTLTVRKQIKDGRNLARGNHAPREIGDSASPLMDKLNGDHWDVLLSPQEIKKIRYWLHAGAHYLGTYAALGCGMIGTDVWNHQIDRAADRLPTTKAATKVLEKRCISCHSGRYHIPRTPCAPEMWSRWRPEARNIVGQYENKFLNHILYNYTHPEKSVQLLGPLAKKAGGYSACRRLVKEGKKTVISDEVVEVFASKEDPDYQTLLKAIQEIKKLHDKDPRWDTKGFVPPPEYIREMKRYGIIPEDLDVTKDPVDFYAIDRKYWEVVAGHHPEKQPMIYQNNKIRKMAYDGSLPNNPSADKKEDSKPVKKIPDDILLECTPEKK